MARKLSTLYVAALFEAFSDDRSITMADFEKAIKNTIPLSVTQAEQIHGIREWANVRAVAATRQEDRSEYHEEAKPKPAKATVKQDDIRTTRGGRTVDF